jgi:hypothetical protein
MAKASQSATDTGAKPRALLISMPFYSAMRPSLQICGLAAVARARGFEVDTLHLSLELAAQIGVGLHEELGTFSGYELGNWLFAGEAFGEADPDPDCRLPVDYPDVFKHIEQFGVDQDRLVALRRTEIPAFLTQAMAATDWQRYQIIGFSSTFQQNNASFALARRLKERFPGILNLFGGANFDGVMGEELVRTNPFIDLAVDGEGDVAFVEVL